MESKEKRALKSLPGSRWDPVSWAEPKVADAFLVRFEKASYSVPYKFIGSSVVNDRPNDDFPFRAFHPVAPFLEECQDFIPCSDSISGRRRAPE